MNLDSVRKYIKSNMNIHYNFVYKCPRNQVEKFGGKITKCYKSIFIIEDDNSIIRSFSYNDFIIKNLKILT